MHSGGKSALNLRHVFPKSEWFPLDLGHINEVSKWFALSLGHDFWGVCSRSLISV